MCKLFAVDVVFLSLHLNFHFHGYLKTIPGVFHRFFEMNEVVCKFS